MQDRKKVLIVDDDEVHLYTAKELLENDQVEVFTHKNWMGAADRIRQLEPDLVLLDINMPAVSGDKLAGIIKPYCDLFGTHVVFYSSNDEDSLAALVRTHGVSGYICKGDIGSLRSKVNEYLCSGQEEAVKKMTVVPAFERRKPL